MMEREDKILDTMKQWVSSELTTHQADKALAQIEKDHEKGVRMMVPGVATGHGENYPHEFYYCPKCYQKGVYVLRDKLGTMLRCKYCKRQKHIEAGTGLGSIKSELKFF